MRLQNASSNGGNEGTDEIFMNFASGRQENDITDSTPQNGGNVIYEDPLDDVFGSAPSSPALRADDENGLTTSSRGAGQDPSDIPRLRSLHVTNGYREGIAVSKEQHVQAGFDEGYSLGAELGMKVGWILGVLEGILRAIPPPSSISKSKRDGGDDSVVSSNGTLTRQNVRAQLALAEDELSMKRLFSDDFFGSDGVWTYPISSAEREGDEEVTLQQIADAHPTVIKWETAARALAGRFDLGIKQ